MLFYDWDCSPKSNPDLMSVRLCTNVDLQLSNIQNLFCPLKSFNINILPFLPAEMRRTVVLQTLGTPREGATTSQTGAHTHVKPV